MLDARQSNGIFRIFVCIYNTSVKFEGLAEQLNHNQKEEEHSKLLEGGAFLRYEISIAFFMGAGVAGLWRCSNVL